MTDYRKWSHGSGGGTAWDGLRRGLAGVLLLPGEPGYEAARLTVEARHDTVFPAAVVRCADEEDVREALRFTRSRGLAVHVRSGGHSPAGLSTGPGVVIDVSPLDAVEVDNGRVHCGAGVSTGAFADALDRHARTVPTGPCPTVGVAGMTLGGGTGTTGRRYGYTLDSLTGVRAVLADGSPVDCDAERNTDLFWALRGGGHTGLGVVTALSFRTYPELPVTDFLLGWPAEHRARVLTAWQEWGPGAPDRLSSMAGISAGEAGGEPHPAVVGGAWLGDPGGLEGQLAALATAVGCYPDSCTTVSHGQRASLRFWGDVPETRLRRGTWEARRPVVLRRHEFFDRRLSDGGVRELIAALDRDLAAGESRHCTFEALGGAYNRVPSDATAMVHRRHLFGMLSEFTPPEHDAGEPASAALDRLHALVRPRASGSAYQNYAEPDRVDQHRTYYGANHARLAEVRERYDPDGVFRPAAQPCAPRGAESRTEGPSGTEGRGT